MNTPEKRPLKRPKHISEYVLACLEALYKNGYSYKISLCGAFALNYYIDEYRTTHDVDAWWKEEATSAEQQAIIDCLHKALQPFGTVNIRRWGDVASIDLTPKEDKQTRFSFQIAHRSARLESSIFVHWPVELYVDAFSDLIASKMTDLVERGAPRDFYDIFTLCHNGLIAAPDCWQLWKTRQDIARSDSSPKRAKIAVLTHLSRIAQHRPLEEINNPEERSKAVELRQWFEEDFINALAD